MSSSIAAATAAAAATEESPMRRSNRTRRPASLEYDEELKALEERKKAKETNTKKKRRNAEDSESEANDDDDDDEDEDKSLSDKDDQEDYAPSNNINNNDKKASKPKPKPPPKVSPPKKQQQQQRQTTKKARRTIQVGGTQKKNTKGGRRGIHALLNRLSKNVLDPSETPETSLVAALLASSKPIPAIESSTPRAALNHDAYAISMYTPQLEGIAKHWLQLHEPNAMHLELLNLLFRSVGGSPSTNLKHGTDLEELDDSEWDTLVTEVVEEMRDNDYVLLCANPAEGVAEYRDIYQEWWYRLGNVLLSHGGGTSTNTSTSTATTGFSSNRFQVELVRELVSRITELVLVGQPDLRAGATIAVLQLSLSIAERTVELTSKLQVAHRQFQSASGTQKKQTLQTNMDSWKRHKAELDEIVQGPVFQGVFIHRYRDSNPFIRVMSLQALSKLTLIRPDLFLNDKFLKYFGWMASDKDAMVRVTALQALLAPFTKFAKEHEYKNKHKPDILQIDIMVMKNVCTKFLGRIVDCTEDSESSQVQEMAMELLLAMLKEEFLDEWEDDHGWEQINLKALDAKTTPKVRKDALYFILEQLDSFDTTEDDDNKSQFTTTTVSEKKQVERVEGIATWIAHQLVEGTVPIEHIRVELVDHVIRSLRDMPEHRPLVVHWTAILKAIRSENPQQGRATGREEVAKQRVLLRMLACAAELEVGSSTAEEGPKTTVSNSTLHEALSLALLRSLPHLLTAFKGDVMALRSLTKLPQYLIPEVFSLPARRNDFQNLVKHLCRLFLESTDEQVLKHISHALSVLVEGGHTRLSEVKMQLKRLSTTLQDRLMELLQESDPQNTKSPAKKKKKKSAERSSPKRRNVRVSDGGDMSSDDDMFSVSPEVDVEKSIHLCLLRWRILLKRCPITYLFEESANEDEEGEVEIFYTTISEAIGKRLDDRKPIVEEDGDADDQTQSIVVPDIWKTGDMTIHPVVANTVDESLQVLNLIVTWKLYQMLEGRMNKNSEENTNIEMELDDDDDDVDVDNLVVGQMRKRLVNLLGLCFDQFLEETEGVAYSDEHVEFVSSVQASAGRVASDVRTLFPREWSRAKDPLLSQLALTDDSQLIGGFARYLKWREPELHALAADKEEDNGGGTLVNDLLMPLARGLTANWDDGNRREAGIALSHITGSGPEAARTIQEMARMLKKINPVRFLESQMTCLRLSFENWVDNEPEELETDRPTEQELHEYEEAEKRHAALFHSMEQQASRLSMCLGVGKLSDKRLSRSVLSFVQEGVRFAFEGNRKEDDDLVLGSRLPFLLVLSKYSSWIKKNKAQLETLKDFLFEKESALRTHPEFDEVHEDDLAALRTFKESLGIRETRQISVESTYAQDDYSAADEDASAIATPSPGTASLNRRRSSSIAGSQRSRMSTQSALSPLEETEERDEVSPSPQKRRRLARSLGDSATKSTAGTVQRTIDEEDEGEDSETYDS